LKHKKKRETRRIKFEKIFSKRDKERCEYVYTKKMIHTKQIKSPKDQLNQLNKRKLLKKYNEEERKSVNEIK
jgi:hypothetical protein